MIITNICKRSDFHTFIKCLNTSTFTCQFDFFRLVTFLIQAFRNHCFWAITWGFLMTGIIADARPAIFNVSDAVTAGTSFNLNGSGFILSSLAVAVEFDTNGTSPATPDLNAAYCSVLVTDKLANFLIARMPDVGTNGVFNCWVGTTAGWSTPIKLNVARPLFLSDYQTFSNGIIEVVGRNFDQREFNGQGRTLARLNNGSTFTTNIAIKDYNPYHMTLWVSNQPPGTYYVEVSNDSGTNWSRTTSGQKLQVLAAPTGNFDPLGLGVEWAKDFAWNKVYNVTNYQITPNITNDCTSKLQSVLDAAEAAGGGVVFFPSGNYYFHTLYIGAGVVLEGQDEYLTKLYYNVTNDATPWFWSKDRGSVGGIPQLQGIARLSLMLEFPTMTNARPDTVINLGNLSTGIVSDQTVRTANRLFIANVNLNYPLTNSYSSTSADHRCIGAVWNGRERVLFKNNTFCGWQATHPYTFMTQYAIDKNNSYEYSGGYVHSEASYNFVENNSITIHPEYKQDSHGVFCRSDAYVANNYINGAGDASNANNDGEGISCECPDGVFNYGSIASTTSSDVFTVAPAVGLINPPVPYGALSMCITYGTGIGQMRPVTGIDTHAQTISVWPAFKVAPDLTSKFTLYSPLKNITFYANTLTNCAKGIWPFGGQCDTVVANNTTINCDGIFLWAARSGPPFDTAAQDPVNQFVRIVRNNVIGCSRRSNQAGIGSYTGRFDTPFFYDTQCYGLQISSNSVTGNNQLIPLGEITETPPYSGFYLSSFPYSTRNTGTGTGDIADTIIEGNTMNDLANGITITMCNYGQYVNNNIFTSSVLNFLVNSALPSDNMVDNQW
jgi:hypothetical protein